MFIVDNSGLEIEVRWLEKLVKMIFSLNWVKPNLSEEKCSIWKKCSSFRPTDMLLNAALLLKILYHLVKQRKRMLFLSILVHELRYIRIFMNIPCLAYPTVRSKIQNLFSAVSYLKRVNEGKRKEKWNTDVTSVVQKLDSGFDIRSSSMETVK